MSENIPFGTKALLILPKYFFAKNQHQSNSVTANMSKSLVICQRAVENKELKVYTDLHLNSYVHM